jgi:excinuclease ABC subunit A
MPHCPQCGRAIQAQTIQEMVDRALRLPLGSRFVVLAPYVAGKKGEHKKQMAEMVKEGFLRARVDGKMVDLDDPPELDKQKKHTIEIVVDRLVAKAADDEEYRKRLADSIETAARVSNGLIILSVADGPEEVLSANYACPDCGTSLTEITPRLFSFNSPYGACTACSGLGTNLKADPERLVVDPGRSIESGAIAILKPGSTNWRSRQMATLAKHYKFRLDTPFGKLSRPRRRSSCMGRATTRSILRRREGRGSALLLRGLVPDRAAVLTENLSSARSSRPTCPPSPARPSGAG